MIIRDWEFTELPTTFLVIDFSLKNFFFFSLIITGVGNCHLMKLAKE
jgi:hypothetical protein